MVVVVSDRWLDNYIDKESSMSAAFDTMTLNGLDFHVWWEPGEEGDWPGVNILVRHPETGLLGTWEPETGAVHAFPEAPTVGDKHTAMSISHDDQALDQILRLMEMVIREDA